MQEVRILSDYITQGPVGDPLTVRDDQPLKVLETNKQKKKQRYFVCMETLSM